MKTIKIILILLLSCYGITTFAQCGIDAGNDQTIICGGYAELNANPKWVLLNSGTTQTLNSVYFVNNDTGYVAGSTGIILKTTNCGTNWTQQTSGSGASLNSIYFVHPDTGYVTGTSGKILKTTDGGTTWTQQTTNMLDMLNSVYFINSNVGYVAGDSGNVGVFLKTTNGGTSWTRQIIETVYGFRSVYFTSIDTGYVVQGSSGNILKTTNGGTSWTTQTTGTGSGFRSLYFTNANTGYVVGDNGYIVKTNDAGANWTSTHISTGYFMCSVYFINTDTGYVVGDASTLLKTSDGGTTWIQQTSGTGTNVTLRSVHFPDANTGYVVGTSGKILKFPVIASYSWSPANSLSDANIANPIANPNVTTKYFVTATSDNGCTAIDSVTINVNPLTVNSGIDKTIVCDGTAQLDSITSNYTGTGTLDYNWSPSAGLNYDTIQNPTANVTSDTKFYVTVTTTNGCTAIDSVNVFVNPLAADAGTDKTIICGGTAQLDNATSNYSGSGTLAYNWSPSAGLNYDTIPNPTANVTSNTKFYVTVSTPNGCTAIDSITVYVNPLIADAGSDKDLICGGAAQLDSITSNYTGSGILTYYWYPSAGLNYDTIPNPTITIIEDTTFFVIVTTPNGCVATDSVNVFVNPMTINGTDGTIICGGSTIMNTTTNYTGTDLLSYSWLPNIGLDSSNVANPVVTIDSNQTYTVTVTTPNGCVATDDVSVMLTPMNAPEICIVSVDSTNKNLVVWNKTVSSAIDTFYIFRETTTNNYVRIGAVPYDSMSVFVDSTSQPDVQSNKYKISIFDDCGLESAKSAYHKTMHLAINQGMGT
ncbi:MAG: YCF48-related protein, partial [Bacteroidota bacterium]